MVWMNDHKVSPMAPQLPWGGVKDSGLGRTRGEAALLECAIDKVVTWDLPYGRPLWWHPYDRTLTRAEALARAEAALAFHWSTIGVQVRIEGAV